MENIMEIYLSLKGKNICEGKGLMSPKNDKQFLYGDVLDYIRDYYPDLSPTNKDILSKLIIGDFVVRNCLL